MILTDDNYYSSEANQSHMSVSQYKQFCKCEAAAMAQIAGEWEFPKTTALLIGSYVDAWVEGTLDEFRNRNPEIFKKNGELKADFLKAEEVIGVIRADSELMRYLGGEKQRIVTAELFGTLWKIKIDSYHPGVMIVDLKVMRSMERIMGKSFVEHWGYDLQMAVYAEVVRRVFGADLETYLAVITKQDPPDKELIHIPRWRREELLSEIERNMPRILAVKAGEIPPQRCEVCDYCRATKVITGPVDFDMVGLSAAEKRAIMGE